MMAEGGYKIDHLNHVPERIRALNSKAKDKGLVPLLDQALHRVAELCRTKPTEWGDPVRNTILPGGTIYRGIVKPLVVHFVVFEKERSIIILDVLPFPRSGLD